MSGEQRVLRVNQLDSTQLDHEILRILKSQLRKSFHYFKPGTADRLEPELNALLRVIIWRFSVYKTGATLGQQLLNIKYKNRDLPSGHDLHIKQKLLLGIIYIAGNWMRERSTELGRIFNRNGQFDKLLGCLRVGERILQFVSVLNFLIFLQKGVYQTIVERILKIQPVFATRQSLRQVSFDYMTRELLWHGFAEFIFFILPLINVRRVQNVFLRIFHSSPSATTDPSTVSKAFHECYICGESPCSPHQAPCGHVYCYYCLKANSMADPAFPCPLCGKAVGTNIRPVEVTVAVAAR